VPERRHLAARIELDRARLLALAPGLDLRLVERHWRRSWRSATAGPRGDRWPTCRRPSGSTGCRRGAARSSRPRRPTSAGPPTRPPSWTACWTPMSGRRARSERRPQLARILLQIVVEETPLLSLTSSIPIPLPATSSCSEPTRTAMPQFQSCSWIPITTPDQRGSARPPQGRLSTVLAVRFAHKSRRPQGAGGVCLAMPAARRRRRNRAG
jgi:hypothetical protein